MKNKNALRHLPVQDNYQRPTLGLTKDDKNLAVSEISASLTQGKEFEWKPGVIQKFTELVNKASKANAKDIRISLAEAYELISAFGDQTLIVIQMNQKVIELQQQIIDTQKENQQVYQISIDGGAPKL